MAWDFATEPEFQEHLDWMRDLVRDEVWPIHRKTAEIRQDKTGFTERMNALSDTGIDGQLNKQRCRDSEWDQLTHVDRRTHGPVRVG